jgi:multiple antibiotic resistance protein
MTLTSVLSVSLILFSVIDIPGSLPVIINMKKEGVVIKPFVATSSAAIIMLLFLFFGAAILGIFGLELDSFALAGSLIILFIGLEMILGIRLFRGHYENGGSGSVVPIAFPLLAGAGTLTTIISLKRSSTAIALLAGLPSICFLSISFSVHRAGCPKKCRHRSWKPYEKYSGSS